MWFRGTIAMWVSPLAMLAFWACNDTSEVECSCASEALLVSVEDSTGTMVAADSIWYEVNDVDTVLAWDSAAPLGEQIVGYKSGTYRLVVWKDGRSSDTTQVTVVDAGPDECRRPSTQKVTVSFDADSVRSAIAHIGGCGD